MKTIILLLASLLIALHLNAQVTQTFSFRYSPASVTDQPGCNPFADQSKTPRIVSSNWKVSHGTPTINTNSNNTFEGLILESGSGFVGEGVFRAFNFDPTHRYNISIDRVVNGNFETGNVEVLMVNGLTENASTTCTDNLSSEPNLFAERLMEGVDVQPSMQFSQLWIKNLFPSSTDKIQSITITDKGAVAVQFTPPSNVQLVSSTQNSLTIKWDGATGTNGVSGYDIFLNGFLAAQTLSGNVRTATLNGLIPCKTYEVKIRARDAQGNVSDFSAPVLFRTNNIPATVVENTDKSGALVITEAAQVVHLQVGFSYKPQNSSKYFRALIHDYGCKPGLFNDLVEQNSSLQDGLFEINLYPNPANRNLFVALAGDVDGLCDYQIFDMSGRLVLTTNTYYSKGSEQMLDMADLPVGIYSLVVTNNGNRTTKRFVKE